MSILCVSFCRQKVLADIEKTLTGGVDASNDTFILMSASVYLLEEVYFHVLYIYIYHIQANCF